MPLLSAAIQEVTFLVAYGIRIWIMKLSTIIYKHIENTYICIFIENAYIRIQVAFSYLYWQENLVIKRLKPCFKFSYIKWI